MNTILTESDGRIQLAELLNMSPDDIPVSGTQSLKEITVYTCVKVLSETLGKLPLKIYQEKDEIRKATDHYLYRLLKLRPNPYMSAFDYWKCIDAQVDLRGNAYAWIEANSKGKITGLYPLDSDRMQIYIDDVGLLGSKNTVWYVYTDKVGHQYKIPESGLCHYKGVTTDGIVGLSPIETLKLTVQNAKASQGFLNNSYKKGMQSAGIIQYTGDLNPKAEETFRNKFEQMSSGLKNANRISLLPIGYQYQSLGLKLTDAQFLENSRFTIQQLTAAFGIKPHQVNDQTKTSYASSSEANREFYTDTLLAKLTGYEQETTYKLLSNADLENGYYFKFNADVILRGDIKSRYETYQIGIQNGILMPNEARKMEEREPAEGGNQLIVNGNYVPLTNVGAAYKKGGNK